MKQHVFPFLVLLGYVLGCHKGKIALWNHFDPFPIKIFPYSIASLPHTDQQLLYYGIHVADDLELARLLEDYLS